MAETVKEAVMYIEQGHVRVGVETVTDPAFHVNRNLEDHVTWVKDSKIRRQIKDFEGERDDYDLMDWNKHLINTFLNFIKQVFHFNFNFNSVLFL